MSVKDELRQMVVRNRNSNQNRQDNALVRAASKVGLKAEEVLERTWRQHVG
ncbi:MAG: hypothetical protein ACUVSQ_05100 [Pseudanabaenaceae cyanobacterium]